jgi:hypothetical protein
MQRRLMALLEIWLPLIGGGILIATAIGAWWADHRVAAVWFGFFGSVALLLLVAFQIQESVSKSEREIPPGIVLDQRPWIEIINISAGPLTFDNDGARLGVAVEIRNTGKTPARNIQFSAAVYLIGAGHMDVEGEHNRFCEKIRERRAAAGEMLFKDRSTTLRNSIPIVKDDIAKYSMPGQTAPFIVPIVIGCVDYGSTLNGERRQSSFSLS